MSKSARSVFIFGIYLLFLGGIVTFAPNFILGIFGIPATSEVWIRVTGMLMFIIGFYYTQAGRMGLKIFYPWTVYMRVLVLLCLSAFVLLKFAPPVLVVFGVVDVLGAIWTALALRSE